VSQPRLIDSHCHLADEKFEPDLEAVIARAREAGVDRALVVLAAADTGEAARARRVCALWPDVRVAIGVHPHSAHEFAADAAAAAAEAVRSQFAATSEARAIGEIGLDYHYDFSPRDVQQEVFREQVRLARALKLPIVIHTREASDDTLAILRDEGGGDVRGVFHCFTGDRALARAALDIGFHLSFAGIVTFPKAAELRDVARDTPADRLLIETDSPYLAPVPHRGKRNEPAYVTRVVETIAEVRGLTPADCGAAAADAFNKLFIL
jgi:TatD DNase family protein